MKEIGHTVKGMIDQTTYSTATNILRLDRHFSGKTCNCEELWQTTKQLQVHEARYEKFADYAPVGIAALDKEYCVAWANKVRECIP